MLQALAVEASQYSVHLLESKPASPLTLCFTCNTAVKMQHPVGHRVLWCLPIAVGYIFHAIVTASVLKNNTAENLCAYVHTTKYKCVLI